MIFNSLTFVVFFAVVLGVWSLPLGWTPRKIFLLVASYIFYMAWNPPFIILLWVSTVVDWFAAQALVKAERPAARRAWMLISVIANLGMLAFFKYGEFLMTNFVVLAASVGVTYSPPAMDIVLPVGISFYTFATMSYTLDIYLRRAIPARNFLDYALFVTFFPHLVAGPIMRPTELVPQFVTPRRATRDQLLFGLGLLTLGLFQKVVLADGFLAPVVEALYDAKAMPGVPFAPGAVDAWLGTLAFAGQIFCDFAGYSTAAIGVALCLGFAMPDNFRFPYAAIGFSDFWKRWHITLSCWLRDYVYIPFGGNRHGEVRTYMALMGTMLLGGLWHGASWTFVVWGGLHGLYLAAERKLKQVFSDWQPGPLALLALGLLTFTLINVTWVFFRADTFAEAGTILAGMAGAHGSAKPILSAADIISAGAIVGMIVAFHWRMRSTTLEAAIERASPVVVGTLWAVMAAAILFEHGAGNAFIYFAF